MLSKNRIEIFKILLNDPTLSLSGRCEAIKKWFSLDEATDCENLGSPGCLSSPRNRSSERTNMNSETIINPANKTYFHFMINISVPD